VVDPGFAKSLAGQVGTDDIAVSIVNPSEVRTEFGKEFREQTSEERYERDEVTGPRAVADAIAFAARQETPNTVSELDLYRRDKFSGCPSRRVSGFRSPSRNDR